MIMGNSQIKTPGKLQIPHRFRVSYSGIALGVEIFVLIVIFFSILGLLFQSRKIKVQVFYIFLGVILEIQQPEEHF